MNVQVWQFLIASASEHRTVTYGEIARAVGGIPQGVGVALNPIASYCESKGLPPLTVIVVGHTSGTPSYPYEFDVDAARQRVFAQNWWRVEPPR